VAGVDRFCVTRVKKNLLNPGEGAGFFMTSTTTPKKRRKPETKKPLLARRDSTNGVEVEHLHGREEGLGGGG